MKRETYQLIVALRMMRKYSRITKRQRGAHGRQLLENYRNNSECQPEKYYRSLVRNLFATNEKEFEDYLVSRAT